MREITTHHVEGEAARVRLFAMRYPAPEGYWYAEVWGAVPDNLVEQFGEVVGAQGDDAINGNLAIYSEGHFADVVGQFVHYQQGAPKTAGANGTTFEARIAADIDRLTVLDAAHPCQENQDALRGLRQALGSLMLRTNQLTCE